MAANLPIIPGYLGARAVVGYDKEGGYLDTPRESNFNDLERKSYRLKLNGKPTEKLTLGASYWGARDDYGGPSTGNDDYKNSSILDQHIASRFDAYELKIAYALSGYSISIPAVTWTTRTSTDSTSPLLSPFRFCLEQGYILTYCRMSC